MKQVKSDILTRKETTLFFKFAIPNILSLVLLSSAGIVDAIFIGNYEGELSLAALNIANPLFSFIWGFTMMVLIGGAVTSSKYIGEKNIEKACNIFTKSMVVVTIITIILSLIIYIFASEIIYTLAGSDKTLSLSVLYIRTVIPFMIFSTVGYGLSMFARVDGFPFIASFTLIVGAFTNILLDYIFIGILNWGIKGAAYATGLSYIATFVILVFHFLKQKGVLKLNLKAKNYKEMIKTSYNGFSEFLNEISVGITMALFNYTMMKYAQEEGVAAFTAINYILWVGNIINYAAADSLNPLISTNYGAGYFNRIKSLLKTGIYFTLLNGVIIIIILSLFNHDLTQMFLSDKSSHVYGMAIDFMSIVKWSFLLSGINMILSAYFTAMIHPKESAIIAFLRSFFMPVSLITILPLLINLNGIYLTLPLSELITFIVAIFLFLFTRKQLLYRR